MDTATVIAIIAVAALVAVVAAGAWYYASRRRTGRLRGRYGPEYDYLSSRDGRRAAERELAERERRVRRLAVRELAPEERGRYAAEWQTLQGRFVDDPTSALVEADVLVQKVMDARGYPVTDFEQQAADVSVDHPEVVRNYRAGHSVAQSARKGEATTEELRQAVLNYRALFAELLGEPAAAGRR